MGHGERKGLNGSILHLGAMVADGRARLCRAVARSSWGSIGNAASGPSHPTRNMVPAGKSLFEAIDPCSRPVGKSGNSCLSRTLFNRAPVRLNPLPTNQFQLNPAGGFPGFPGNFPGVCMVGGWRISRGQLTLRRNHAWERRAGGNRDKWHRNPALFRFGGEMGQKALFKNSPPKNQAGSRWLKANQGGSRHFETFFYGTER